jgi:hypothetical protein
MANFKPKIECRYIIFFHHYDETASWVFYACNEFSRFYNFSWVWLFLFCVILRDYYDFLEEGSAYCKAFVPDKTKNHVCTSYKVGLTPLLIGFKTAYIPWNQNGLISFSIQQIFLGFSTDPMRLRLSWSIQVLQYDQNCRLQAFVTTELDESGDPLIEQEPKQREWNFSSRKINSIKLILTTLLI